MSADDCKPVYVLKGPDAFLRDAYRKEVMDAVVADGDPRWCVTVVDAEVGLADVLDALRTPPFLSPRRLVIVEDADAFVAGNRPALETYLEAPATSGVLLLCVSSWAGTTRLAKRVAKIGRVYDCTAPDARRLPEWLRKAFGKRGKTIDRPAAALLAEMVGEDLGALNSEVDKLTAYVGDRDRVTPADVEAIVPSTAGPRAFALSNAITAQDPPAALRALDEAVARRGDEFKTLGGLRWHLRRALAVQQKIAGGVGPQAALRDAKVYYGQREFLEMLRRRPLATLQEDFRRLLRCDLALKSGTEPTGALRDLVLALTT